MPKKHQLPLPDEVKESIGIIDISSVTAKKQQETVQDNQSVTKKDEFISKREIIILAAVFIIVILSILAILFIPSMIKGRPLNTDDIFLANYDMPPTDRNYIYNGFSFIKMPDERTDREFWYTQISIGNNMYEIPMHFGPREVENVSVDTKNRSSTRRYNKIYISIEPDFSNASKEYTALAVSELSEKITKIMQTPIEAACTRNETSACQARRIVNCDMMEYQNSSLIFTFDDKALDTRISIDGNCILIQGSKMDLVRATDKLIYQLIGIMK